MVPSFFYLGWTRVHPSPIFEYGDEGGVDSAQGRVGKAIKSLPHATPLKYPRHIIHPCRFDIPSTNVTPTAISIDNRERILKFVWLPLGAAEPPFYSCATNSMRKKYEWFTRWQCEFSAPWGFLVRALLIYVLFLAFSHRCYNQVSVFFQMNSY